MSASDRMASPSSEKFKKTISRDKKVQIRVARINTRRQATFDRLQSVL